ncbi:MAG: hypothetical protein SFU56_19595 [Capsulimonadales bacterium]|nr:hypothetical protein [Capsulimonadales bacterium]
MAFAYDDRLREEYVRDGFTILRGIIPPSLLSDLRREADRARDIARRQHGAQAQRLQPVYEYDELNHRPFTEFLELPDVQTVRGMLLGPDHTTTRNMGILLEPAEHPWCTQWHRDWGYNVPDLDLATFFEFSRNLATFCQFNGALYDDHSLWAVPGSHNREDTPEERAAFPVVPPPSPDFSGARTPEERERLCQEYVRSMPGATQVSLFAGDVAIYRASCWHIGNYVPYVKRATLHDNFVSPDDLRWREEVPKMQERIRAARAKASV